ncbi:hypothetical protein [Streptomyces sp. 6N223]|uniref:hypothetical protein n=1 Tax=Streptomyces sp. 6N223 TaxID=3457412 RepID=UPI003FD4A3E8
MTKSVLVRCPECRREHTYVPAHYPCACGAPVTPGPRGASVPVPVRHRSWSEAWTEVDCPACGLRGQWPRPELDCPCGTTLRLAAPGEVRDAAAEPGAGGRPPFRPLTIRTAHDAVACAARFLRWLGFEEVYTAAPYPRPGVDLRGPAVVGLVDASTGTTGARTIETLWLHGLHEAATAVAFSLAGYDRPARVRADELHVPLFVFDLTGSPQPVNDLADELLRAGRP